MKCFIWTKLDVKLDTNINYFTNLKYLLLETQTLKKYEVNLIWIEVNLVRERLLSIELDVKLDTYC